MLAAVNYHYIRRNFDAPYPGIHGITPDAFEKQLKILQKLTNFVGQEQILQAVLGGKPLPEKATIITFDDGLKEQIKYALPILKKLNIPAIFFINTKTIETPSVLGVHKIHILRSRVQPKIIVNFLKQYLNQKQLTLDLGKAYMQGVAHYKYDTPETAQLKFILNFQLSKSHQSDFINTMFSDLIEESEEEIWKDLYLNEDDVSNLAHQKSIGSHSHNHHPIGLMSQDQKCFQVENSKRILENLSNKEIYSFSYPYGSKKACENLADILGSSGYQFAFTMERAINTNLTNPYYLARFDNNDMPMGKSYKEKSQDYFKYYQQSIWWN